MAQETLKLMVEQMALFMAPTRTHSRHKEPSEKQNLGQSWASSARQALAPPFCDRLPTCMTQWTVRKSPKVVGQASGEKGGCVG